MEGRQLKKKARGESLTLKVSPNLGDTGRKRREDDAVLREINCRLYSKIERCGGTPNPSDNAKRRITYTKPLYLDYL